MRSVLQSVWIASCVVLCIGAVPRNTVAEDATSFRNPTGWSIGDANSTYQEWDAFTAKTNNAPDIGHFPGSFAPTLSTVLSALVTGTHNLYSMSGDYDWWADIKNYGGTGAGTDVIVQVATTLNGGVGVYPNSLAIVQPDGSPILGGDYTSVLQATTLFEGQTWSAAMGQYVTSQERLWEFFLPDYTGDFRVEGTSIVHSSLMQVQVDSMISPVPEPGTTALAGSGLIVLGACRIVRRWRRRKGRNV